MSISTLACRYGMNGQTLRKQYKEKISGYRQWDQLPHAEEYLLFPENVGADLSLDETCLSNGEVYTVLTDKSARGRKGALVSIIRGVATDKVSAVLLKLPWERRKAVKSITTDLSSAMMLTARRVFPTAKLVNDRFHVQQLMSEAVDQLRIRFRWQVLEEENSAYASAGRCSKKRTGPCVPTARNGKPHARSRSGKTSVHGNPPGWPMVKPFRKSWPGAGTSSSNMNPNGTDSKRHAPPSSLTSSLPCGRLTG